MAYVPTERILIRPETQGNYSPGNGGRRMIKFFIPPSVGFIDTNDLILRSTITMSGDAGHARPNPRAGIASLYRNISIRSGTNNALIEQLDAYNGLACATLDYSANDSIANLRTLIEGVDQGAPNSDTSALNSLYWKPLVESTTPGTYNTTQTAAPLLTEMPIRNSGILSGGRAFPVMATGGLRVEMQLDEPNRSLMPFVTDSGKFTLTAEIGTGAFTTPPGSIKDFTSTVVVATADLLGFQGWRVGQKVIVNLDNGTAAADLEVATVKIAESKLVLGVKYTGSATDYPPLGRKIAVGAEVTQGAHQSSYTLSDLALVFNKVTPPQGYQQSLLKQVASGAGLQMDFTTFGLIRSTLPSASGMLSQNIPAMHPEAYSILSIPYDSSKFNTLNDDTFAPDFTGAISYQYFVGGEATPNRAVPLQRLALTVPIPEALHLREMVKALENAGITVRNLIRCQTRSLIGRALSVQGQVADISNGDLRLQTEYGSGATVAKQFDNHIAFCSSMTIQDSNVSIRR